MDWTLRSYYKRDLFLLARKLSYENCFSIDDITGSNIGIERPSPTKIFYGYIYQMFDK